MSSKLFDGRAAARVLSPATGWVVVLALGLVLAACAALDAVAATVPPVQGGGPTVKEVVEFTRLVPQNLLERDSLRGRVSPDGLQAFVVTRRADVARDKTVYEILLLDLRPGRLARAQQRPPRRVLRIEATADNDFSRPFVQDARWVDRRTLVFRGRLADAPYQVYRLDVLTGRVAPLTFAPLGIASFALSADLRRVVYATPVPNPPMREGARSVVVANKSFWSVKFGQDDMRSQQRRYQYVAAESGSARPGRKLGETVAEMGGMLPPISLAPDGRWALIPRFEAGRQPEWVRQYPLVKEMAAKYGPAVSQDPLGYYTTPRQWVARRHVAYRLADGLEQPVFDAPDDAGPGVPQTRDDRIWQRGGQSVVIAGTHLPGLLGSPGQPNPPSPLGSMVDKANAAPGGGASHVIEYWPETRRWVTVAKLVGRLDSAQALSDGRDGFVAVDDGKSRTFLRRADGSWKETDEVGSPALPELLGERATAGWTLRIDQALNRPAEVVATGPGGRTVALTRLNPQFVPGAWGLMRPYTWVDAKNRPWEGGLMLPADYDPRRKYPLVIQTYGFTPERFYLDGTNLADQATSGFAGRAFLRENLLVLALPVRAAKDAPTNEHERSESFADGVQAAIDALASQGLIYPERVGLMGWSATGERALNMLTFRDTPIRAATLLDGDSNTIFSMTVAYGFNDGAEARFEQSNQGAPFGPGLVNWIRNDPALHTDCIKAAVRIETYGPWVLGNWDIHTLLRRQYKPVEMVVIPGGMHSLARPSERMISLQGNVDWYRYWLNGEERSAVTLRNETAEDLRRQYQRWREMAEMKANQADKPRCAAQAGQR